MKYVYLLRSDSNPNQTYVGSTADFTERLKQHNSGKPPVPPRCDGAVRPLTCGLLLTCSPVLPLGTLTAFLFENLQVYEKAVGLADNVAGLTESFPRGYYFLVDQLTRAALSVATNPADPSRGFVARASRPCVAGASCPCAHGRGAVGRMAKLAMPPHGRAPTPDSGAFSRCPFAAGSGMLTHSPARADEASGGDIGRVVRPAVRRASSGGRGAWSAGDRGPRRDRRNGQRQEIRW